MSAQPMLIDGVESHDDVLSVRVGSPLLQSGFGLFETMLVWNGTVPLLARHLARLLDSARELRCLKDVDAEVLRTEVRSVAARAPRALLRLVLFEDHGATRRVVHCEALPADRMLPAHAGLAAAAFQGPRPLAAHKTLNNMQTRLAAAEARERGLDEVLLCLPDGRLLEGTRSSLFLVRAGTLLTPARSLPILPGITREVILEVARSAGVPCGETDITVADLLTADEAFITASVRGVRALATWEGTPLRGVDGPMTARLREEYARLLTRNTCSE